MKTIKRICSLVLALVMVMAMTTTAVAAGGGTSTPPATGNLTVTGCGEEINSDVSAYQIFAMDTDGESYVLNTQFEGYFTSFNADFFKDIADLEAKSEKAYQYVLGLSQTSDPTIQAFADGMAAWIAGSPPAVTATQTVTLKAKTGVTNVSTGTFENLEAGYYLLKGDKTQAMLLNFKAEGTAPTIALKATHPTVDKTVDNGKKATTAAIGDDVTFTLTSQVPNTTAYTSTYTFKFVDTLSKGLTYKTGSAKVSIGEGVGKTELSTSEFIVNAEQRVENWIVTIDISGKIKALGKDAAYVGKTITVTYSATINSKAVIVDAANAANTNSAIVEYSNDPVSTSTGTSKPSVVRVYSFQVDIDKVSAGTDSKLKEAQFVLYKVENGVKKYYYLNGTNAAWTAHEEITKPEDIQSANITIVETNADGAAAFKGLAAGTYYLREIKAPDGYNVLTDPTPVTIAATIDETTGDLTNWKINENTEKDSKVKIENHTGATLPETGAMGTVIFSVLGVVLVIGGTLMLGRHRKKND